MRLKVFDEAGVQFYPMVSMVQRVMKQKSGVDVSGQFVRRVARKEGVEPVKEFGLLWLPLDDVKVLVKAVRRAMKDAVV